MILYLNLFWSPKLLLFPIDKKTIICHHVYMTFLKIKMIGVEKKVKKKEQETRNKKISNKEKKSYQNIPIYNIQ